VLATPSRRCLALLIYLASEASIVDANVARMNLHIHVSWGENNHYIAEAIYKAFGRSLRDAVQVTGDDVASTKGTL